MNLPRYCIWYKIIHNQPSFMKVYELKFILHAWFFILYWKHPYTPPLCTNLCLPATLLILSNPVKFHIITHCGNFFYPTIIPILGPSHCVPVNPDWTPWDYLLVFLQKHYVYAQSHLLSLVVKNAAFPYHKSDQFC